MKCKIIRFLSFVASFIGTLSGAWGRGVGGLDFLKQALSGPYYGH